MNPLYINTMALIIFIVSYTVAIFLMCSRISQLEDDIVILNERLNSHSFDCKSNRCSHPREDIVKVERRRDK
jgi:hypothetical protein